MSAPAYFRSDGNRGDDIVYYDRNGRLIERKSKRRRKMDLQDLFKIVVIVLVLGVMAFGLVNIVALFESHDGYTEADLGFSIGEIVVNDTGKGVSDNSCTKALYTPKPVACTGFRIETDFDHATDYEMHFYTEDNEYVGYIVASGLYFEMKKGTLPYLKDLEGSYLLNDPEHKDLVYSQEYKDADFFLDENGNKKQASYVRIVLRPQAGSDGMFGNTFLTKPWFTKQNFAGSVSFRYTTALSTSVSVNGSADATEASE